MGVETETEVDEETAVVRLPDTVITDVNNTTLEDVLGSSVVVAEVVSAFLEVLVLLADVFDGEFVVVGACVVGVEEVGVELVGVEVVGVLVGGVLVGVADVWEVCEVGVADGVDEVCDEEGVELTEEEVASAVPVPVPVPLALALVLAAAAFPLATALLLSRPNRLKSNQLA